jgi:hypothetical protein
MAARALLRSLGAMGVAMMNDGCVFEYSGRSEEEEESTKYI